MARRPRIGMVADRREASFGAWRDVELCFVWSHYVEAIERAGGAPVAFPAIDLYAEGPEAILDAVDGLVLCGGRDVDASVYGESPHPENDPSDPLRDRVELAVIRAAIEADVPLLGVCRGAQLLNLVAGGGIDQHLADPQRIHRHDPGAFVDHAIETTEGTRLAEALGPRVERVRSHHHQGLDPVGGDLVVSGRAPDGLVEAVELPERSFCLGVLWHPEELLDSGGLPLYEALVEAASARAGVAA